MTTKRKMVHTYLTPEQKEIVQRDAKAAGLTVSKYIISLLFPEPTTTPVPTPPVRHRVAKPDRTVPQPAPAENGIARGPMIAPPRKRNKISS